MVRVYKYKNKVDARGNIHHYNGKRDDANLKYEDGQEVFSGSLAQCEDYITKVGKQKINDLKLKNPDGHYRLNIQEPGGFFNRYDPTGEKTRCPFILQVIDEDAYTPDQSVVFEEYYRIMSDDEAEKDNSSVDLKNAKLYGYSAAKTLYKIRYPDIYVDIPYLFDSIISTYSDAYKERYMKILNSSGDEKLFDNDNSEWSLTSEKESTPGYNIALLLKNVAGEIIYSEIWDRGEYPYEDGLEDLALDPDPIDIIIVSQENQDIEGTMLSKRLTFDMQIYSGNEEMSDSIGKWSVSATYEHASTVNGSSNQLSNLYYVLLEILKSMYEQAKDDTYVSSDIESDEWY